MTGATLGGLVNTAEPGDGGPADAGEPAEGGPVHTGEPNVEPYVGADHPEVPRDEPDDAAQLADNDDGGSAKEAHSTVRYLTPTASGAPCVKK